MASQATLGGLRDRVASTIARNLHAFGAGPAQASSANGSRRAIPGWDIPAKIDAARRIAEDERRRHAGHQNDRGDAERHAEWSKPMADDLGPGFSTMVGLAHEIQEMPPPWLGGRSQPPSEMVMDLHNNAEGVSASRERQCRGRERFAGTACDRSSTLVGSPAHPKRLAAGKGADLSAGRLTEFPFCS